MKKNIEAILISIIQDSLKELGLDKNIAAIPYLDLPAQPAFGDYSTNVALKTSSVVKKTPLELAELLAENIKKRITKSPLKKYVKEVKSEGSGFINFYFSNEYFYAHTLQIIKEGRNALKLNLGRGRPVLIEFVSANPTGPLSVAHARQAAVGDVLANILDFLGFKVKREYYLNDEGN
ncbi:MAG: arginine--tRNA ligase, partial [Candidatus Omnitrophica bacterium]|nr:arginine--tRNA ligase [Candidatus Omnitrophota bacterium]